MNSLYNAWLKRRLYNLYDERAVRQQDVANRIARNEKITASMALLGINRKIKKLERRISK